jgi:hypothetical protein
MLKKILTYMAAAATACYLLFAFVIVPMQKENDNCKGIAINISNNIIPAACTQFSYFAGIGLRNTISINIKKSLPPSSAGMGRRLNTPIFIDINAIILISAE